MNDIDVNFMRVEAMVNEKGGILEIPGSGFKLDIPRGALEDERLIQMRIIPRSVHEEYEWSLFSNSTLTVELLPNNIKLMCPVQLTMPHCVQLKKTGERKALVYNSHHTKGTKPIWKPQHDTRYHLNETDCIIWLDSFSWETFEIDDKIVECKKIKVYAALKERLPSKLTSIEVGYYVDLPGAKEILVKTVLQVLKEKPFLFQKEGECPLEISFDTTIPISWECIEETKKKIPFSSVAASSEYSCPFLFKKVREEDCSFVFKVRQNKNTIELVVPMKKDANTSTSSKSEGETCQPVKDRDDQNPDSQQT